MKRKFEEIIYLTNIEEEEEEEEGNNCTICLEIINKNQKTTLDSCQHEFCFECIKTWSKKANTCPVCR
jgi:hypothetical protein